MTRLIRLIRQIVALLMLIAGLLGSGKQPAPPVAPPAAAPPATATAPAPPRIVPHGPTPSCSVGMGVKLDGSRSWIVVCTIYGQSTTLPGEWPSEKVARAAKFDFQQAWRDAVRNGTPL